MPDYQDNLTPELRATINNPARAKNAQLRTAVQFLKARLEAEFSANIALRDELRAAHDTIAEFQDQLSAVQERFTEVVDTTRHVRSRAELLMQLRQMTREGVPCHMQGDFIKHRKTGAVLAQVRT